jgi:hypothetical protein
MQRWDTTDSEYIKNNPNKNGFIFAYFTNICDACLTGRILATINNFFEWHLESFGVLLILGKDYTNNDLYNMKLALNIGYDLTLQSPLLSDVISAIDTEFRENILNNTVIFADSAGRILKVFQNSCNCWDSFMSYVNEFPSLIKKQELSTKD